MTLPAAHRVSSPLTAAVGIVAALCLAFGPSVPQALPPLPDPGGEGGKISAQAAGGPLQVLAAEPAELHKASGGSASSSGGGRRWSDTFAPPLFGRRDVALQLRLSLSSAPAPSMHLSAHARRVLFPEQGPPSRRA